MYQIGVNVTIDRGTLAATIIGAHVKIDNLVQLAHNVIIGDGSIIVAQSGIAGSRRLRSHAAHFSDVNTFFCRQSMQAGKALPNK